MPIPSQFQLTKQGCQMGKTGKVQYRVIAFPLLQYIYQITQINKESFYFVHYSSFASFEDLIIALPLSLSELL